MAEANENRALYADLKNDDLSTELGDRGLPKTGTKPEMVERLVAHDAEIAAAKAAAEDPAAEPDAPPEAPEGDTPPPAPDAPAPDDTTPDPEPEDADLCVACWPDGWPTPDTANASCEHGTWDRNTTT